MRSLLASFLSSFLPSFVPRGRSRHSNPITATATNQEISTHERKASEAKLGASVRPLFEKYFIQMDGILVRGEFLKENILHLFNFRYFSFSIGLIALYVKNVYENPFTM